jgi:hypothetical protein
MEENKYEKGTTSALTFLDLFIEEALADPVFGK